MPPPTDWDQLEGNIQVGPRGAVVIRRRRLSTDLGGANGSWLALGRNNVFGCNVPSVSGTDVGGTSTLVYKIQGSAKNLKLLVGTFRTSVGGSGAIEIDGYNNIPTIKASIESPLGQTPVSLTKSGASSWSAGATVGGFETDSVALAVADQDTLRSRYYVAVNSPDRYMFTNNTITNAESTNHASQGGNSSDLTGVSGTFVVTGPSGQFSATPMVLIGLSSDAKSILLIGDSIGAGRGYTASSTRQAIKYNWFDLGIVDGKINSTNAAISGATDITFFGGTALLDTRTRRKLFQYHTAVLDQNGINDIAYLPTWQNVASNKLLMAALAVVPYYVTTLPPRVTMTDNGVTTTGQTKSSVEALRIGFNDWVRGGCQVDGGGNPVISGGVPSPLIRGYVDLASAVEVDITNTPTVNGGFWKVPTSAGLGPYTLTGTPTTTSFTIAIAPWTTGNLTGQVIKMLTGARAGQVAVIANNHASDLTIYANGSTAQSGIAVTGLSGAPTAGDTFEIWDVYSNEGLHPAIAGHIAESVPMTAFVNANF